MGVLTVYLQLINSYSLLINMFQDHTFSCVLLVRTPYGVKSVQKEMDQVGVIVVIWWEIPAYAYHSIWRVILAIYQFLLSVGLGSL